MTQDKLIEAAKALVARWDSPDWKDAAHTADYIHALRDAVNDAELPKPQPTPSQSNDERKEFEKAATELGLLFCGRFIDEHYKLWQARAQLSKPQPTSQDAADAERYRFLRDSNNAKDYVPFIATFSHGDFTRWGESKADKLIAKHMKESK